MKIAPLLLASATALETASTAHNLLSAVGHRNATKMEALVQGLVEESISEPGWKFDKDIVDALEAIRTMFVKNIQAALKDAHKVNQEQVNCDTETCFGACVTAYESKIANQCDTYTCEAEDGEQHKECREGYWTRSSDHEVSRVMVFDEDRVIDRTGTYGVNGPLQHHLLHDTQPVENNIYTVYPHFIDPLDLGEPSSYTYPLDYRTPKKYRVTGTESKPILEEFTSVKHKYIRMAQDCGALHSFIHRWTFDGCSPESCLCPELSNCHSGECHPQAGDCTSGYGAWLQSMISKYDKGFEKWSVLHKECRLSYHAFLTEDLNCDAVQKKFERCMCDWRRCHHTACHNDYQQCHDLCWSTYKEHVFETECLEKDRKIDWSATKKIECYVDILLHDYTKEELVTKCGDENCINKAREEDYKHCQTICLEVDHDGEWPTVGEWPAVSGHAARTRFVQDGEESEYLLGDGQFDCDSNGNEVFTRHRGGGSTREEEKRCTEHLDIDYQVPKCITCEQPVPPVCDQAFHQKWYFRFDNTEKIAAIKDRFDNTGEKRTCNKDDEATCFDDFVMEKSSSDGVNFESITVSEHSHAWAFNRCPCTNCVESYPQYPPVNEGVCGEGAHTLVKPVASGVASGDGSYEQ